MSKLSTQHNEREIPILVIRFVGIVVSIIGILGVAFIFWLTYNAVKIHKVTDTFFLGFSSVVGIVTLFCLTVGYRLTLNRPNSNGSILSSNSRRAVGFVFAIVVLIFIISFVVFKDLSFLSPIVFGSIFSTWCFRAARGLNT